MKRIYAKESIGYLADNDFYCLGCWREYLAEKKMTAKISIDEEVWEHDLFSEDVAEVEGASKKLVCNRCGKVFGPKEPWKNEEVLVHE